MSDAAVVRDLRGTWPRALGSLLGAVLVVLVVRWALFEPYVIPSKSMLPTLLVKDHILVNKFAYGLRFPFTSNYAVTFGRPTRGDVVVFRSVEDDAVFMVKRVVAVEGDELTVAADGQISIGGVPVPRRELREEEISRALSSMTDEDRSDSIERFVVAEEQPERGTHLTFTEKEAHADEAKSYTIPPGHVFLMGDNRDHSSDSRVWGALPMERILGRASVIWLSCEESLQDSNQLCDPELLRPSRIFTRIP